jgi:hypothetical protein
VAPDRLIWGCPFFVSRFLNAAPRSIAPRSTAPRSAAPRPAAPRLRPIGWLAGWLAGWYSYLILYGDAARSPWNRGNVNDLAGRRFWGLIRQCMVWGEGQKRFVRKCVSVPCGACVRRKKCWSDGVRTAVRMTQAPRDDLPGHLGTDSRGCCLGG